jgi:type II secretory ATPase GspE/PulE/Tfp pilus assembly ATPase PilB-like protein
MVGEIRDNETAALAVNAALTGHLVLSTLHTNSAAGAIPRLLDMKVEPFLLSSTLQVILAQRLVRKLGASKEKYFLNKEEIESLGKDCLARPGARAAEGRESGCSECSWESVPFWKPQKGVEGDGYQGRIGIYEVLKMAGL